MSRPLATYHDNGLSNVPAIRRAARSPQPKSRLRRPADDFDAAVFFLASAVGEIDARLALTIPFDVDAIGEATLGQSFGDGLSPAFRELVVISFAAGGIGVSGNGERCRPA